MHLKIITSYVVFASLYISCSGIQMLSGQREDLYGASFLKQIESIKEQYSSGAIKPAMLSLQKMKEEDLNFSQKALRRNLMGVIQFAEKDYEAAISNFDLALATSGLDESLTAQIYLNLASCYFKLDLHEKSYATLELVEVEKLNLSESMKRHLLKFKVAKELEKTQDAMAALVQLLGEDKVLAKVKQNPYFAQLKTEFLKLDSRGRYKFLEKFEEDNLLCISYLAFLEAEGLYYSRKKEESQILVKWIQDTSQGYPEILELVENFGTRISNSSVIDPNAIGLVLPITGKKANFGKRALFGFDSGIQGVKKARNYNVWVKDSMGSGTIGAHRVRELALHHHVSVIIGGLFSNEATKEYLEAKKHGVFFISLSQVYLPKKQKDYLLLEIPGSIESQVNQLLSENMLEHFGKKAAILFPNSPRGNAYLDELWRKATPLGVKITDAIPYEMDKTDYRDSVSKLLGLHFTRERQEELDLLKEINSLKKHSSVRRIQTLKPQVDFDWVFIPSYPKDALQIVPSFAYFDAFGLNIIGGPSWRSHSLAKQSSKLRKLHFIGDEIHIQNKSFSLNFKKQFKKQPKLIEMRAYDAFLLTDLLLASLTETSRDSLDILIRERDSFSGVSGNWRLVDDVWIKDMFSYKFRRGEINKLVYDEFMPDLSKDGKEAEQTTELPGSESN
ncbi:MAG: ABC transporter substrate-binding protein [Bacteriovoracaceae bacterium]|nr:ABC transporter substrate-binding protein [Bacteriovoracaceae bacterium]